MPTVLYVDVERRSLAEKAKLAGIKRCADAYGWKVRVVWEIRSRPDVLSKALARQRPIGCIVECAAGHEDLPPKVCLTFACHGESGTGAVRFLGRSPK